MGDSVTAEQDMEYQVAIAFLPPRNGAALAAYIEALAEVHLARGESEHLPGWRAQVVKRLELLREDLTESEILLMATCGPVLVALTASSASGLDELEEAHPEAGQGGPRTRPPHRRDLQVSAGWWVLAAVGYFLVPLAATWTTERWNLWWLLTVGDSLRGRAAWLSGGWMLWPIILFGALVLWPFVAISNPHRAVLNHANRARRRSRGREES